MKRTHLLLVCLLTEALIAAGPVGIAEAQRPNPRAEKQGRHQGGGQGNRDASNFTVPPELVASRRLNLVLGRPTDCSIALSVMSAADIDAQVEYGEKRGTYSSRTTSRKVTAWVPVEFELQSLRPDTRYYYRLLTRPSGMRDFRPEPEGTFHTQRRPGSVFTFVLQGDSHPERQGKMYDAELYAQTLHRVAKDPPDFYLTMGDDFSIDRLLERKSATQTAVDKIYAHQRTFLSVVGRSSALFLVNGNHEHGDLCLLDGTENNAAVMAGVARLRYYPLPAPDGFYTGDTEKIPFVGLPRDYYAWTWGDALFVVIDFYWHSPVAVDHLPGEGHHEKGQKKEGGRKRDPWGPTLGDVQYRWLTKTLTESNARWKFVFCHHVLGTGRGGIELAGQCEWGGKDKRGVYDFPDKRPGWPLPIHQLMAKTGVTIFFQGHDHLFARQELDGVAYQSCPNPADNTYEAFNRGAYQSGDVLPNCGFLRVTVSPQKVGVDYIRSYLPKDATSQHPDGEVAFHYEVPATSKTVPSSTGPESRYHP